MDDRQIKSAVSETYGELARRFQNAEATAGCGCASSDCCGDSQAIGLYGPGEVVALPDTVVNASLGCGNPLALASLKEGETVLDLGSGAGLDCFLAARRVGPTGRVIGLDMTPAMLALARDNAAHLGVSNVEFRQGEMEAIPLADASVDVIISNCVINLSPDKDAVFREAFRVLRPGGRLSVSDIVTSQPLPEMVRQNLRAWNGCVGGALELTTYVEKLRATGFERIEVDREGGDVCCSNSLVFSAHITAFKPQSVVSTPQSYFARVAEKWDSLRATFFSEAVREAAIRQAAFPAGATVADVGTGTGFLAMGLAPIARQVYGLDASPEMLTVARRNLAGFTNVEWRVAEGAHLPLPDSSVDAALANMYLHHAEDPAAAIREMARIVRAGGRVVLTDLDSHTHEWLLREHADRWPGFARADVRRWLEEAGLTDIVVDSVGENCCASSAQGEAAAIGIFVASGRKV